MVHDEGQLDPLAQAIDMAGILEEDTEPSQEEWQRF